MQQDSMREGSFALAEAYWEIPDTKIKLKQHVDTTLVDSMLEKAREAVKASQKKLQKTVTT
eukprot:10961046-Karenia_brevis.AAC.1